MSDQVTQPPQITVQPMHDARDETLRVIQSVMQAAAAQPVHPISSPLKSSLASLADDEIQTANPTIAAAPRHSLIATVFQSFLCQLRKFTAQHVTPRRCAIVLLAVAVWMYPWFVPAVFLCFMLLIGLLWLVLGTDRMTVTATWVWRVYEKRAPGRAADLTARALYYREWAQTRLERLPFRWAQRLYLPFWPNEMDDAEAEKAYAARMAKLAQDG